MAGAAVTTDEQLLYEETNNIAPYTYRFIAKLIAPITTNNLKQLDHISASLGFDPIPYWQEVQAPVLMAFGGHDKNVPVEASIARLKENNLNHFEVKAYPDGGHAIRDIQTNEVSGEYLQDLVKFVNKQ